MSKKRVRLGPVQILRGRHRGRIGDCDDFTSKGRSEYGIVTFGDPLLAASEYEIPLDYMVEATTDALLVRRDKLTGATTGMMPTPLKGEKRAEAFEELRYVEAVLSERAEIDGCGGSAEKSSVFISYSSKDRKTAKCLAIDIRRAGHTVWLDEWRISVGESIPQRLEEGLSESTYLVVLLSQHAVASKWVEREWQAKYWEEINRKRIVVLPVLLEDCEVPVLLRAKKYADLRRNYRAGFAGLMKAIGKRG